MRAQESRSSLHAFVSYIRQYLQEQSFKTFFFTILFVAVLVTLNYTVGIERRLLAIKPLPLSLAGFFIFYGSVLGVVWGLQVRGDNPNRKWRWMLVLAPLYFAFKMIHWDLLPLFPSGWSAQWDHYALILLQLPAKLLLLGALIYGCWKIGLLEGSKKSGSTGMTEGTGPWQAVGLTRQGFNPRPYFLLLLLLLPLIALASTQHDFLRFYPKLKNLAFLNGYAHPAWPWKLLYELSYGLDFLSIELFFRGFLVIGLARWVGTNAILPMAAFYCTVHFGKPLGECISSFFGGMVLGVLAARTRSILGGLMVHLGLAWLMEVGGWIGNLFR